MTTVNLTLRGQASVLVHNVQLASPLDDHAKRLKAISSKRNKTEQDHSDMAEIEFHGSLYLTDDGSIGIPTWNVLRAIQDGGKKNKNGKKVMEGLLPASIVEVIPLAHDGPSQPDDAWRAGCFDQRPVKVGTSRVTRTRPKFEHWTVDVDFIVDDEVLKLDELLLAAETAGRLVGIGDYRPRFGRFDVTMEVV